MKFTIKQFENYLKSQDTLGDIYHNLSVENIIKSNRDNKIPYFETEVDANDYLVELEDHQGEGFQIGEDVYEISYDVTSFIREYGYDNYSQMRTSIDELLQNGLIKMI